MQVILATMILEIQMTEQPKTEDSERICSCGEMHKGHICWLSQMGLLNEVYHLTSSPTVSCSKCGAKANLPHNVCFPAALE
jgi:NAD(P)H-nitrite reductase large subunit